MQKNMCHQFGSKSSLNLIDIATDTKDDKTLQSVILSVKINQWDRKLIQRIRPTLFMLNKVTSLMF